MRGKGALGSSASEVFQMGPEGNPTFTAPSSMPEALATSQLLTKALGLGCHQSPSREADPGTGRYGVCLSRMSCFSS